MKNLLFHFWQLLPLNGSVKNNYNSYPFKLQVETIGDAYMVVGGIPKRTPSHAENVIRFAMAQHLAIKHLKSPVSDEPIKVNSAKFNFIYCPIKL